MALLFIDGFETYGAIDDDPTDELNKKWSYCIPDSDGYPRVATGRDGGKGLLIRSDTVLYYQTSTDMDTVICGFAVKRGGGSIIGDTFFTIERVAGGANHLHLEVESDYSVGVYLLGSGSADDTSAADTLTTDWIYLEIKLVIDDSTGSYEIKADGSTIVSNSGIDTNNGADSSGTRIKFDSNYYGIVIDDFYLCDGTGAQNNDFLGDSSIVAIDPTSDVTTDWGTYGGSTHYELLDDDPSDEDTTYIETGSPTAVDLFGFEDVTTLLGTLHGIQVCAEISDSSDATDLRIVSGVTTSDAEGVDITTQSPSYINFTRVVELDPNTSAAWTLANLNAAQFGAILGS